MRSFHQLLMFCTTVGVGLLSAPLLSQDFCKEFENRLHSLQKWNLLTPVQRLLNGPVYQLDPCSHYE